MKIHSIILFFVLSAAALIARPDVSQYKMYSFQSLLDMEALKLEQFITSGSINSVLPKYRKVILNEKFDLKCLEGEFEKLKLQKRDRDEKLIQAYQKLSYEFQRKYDPFYQVFFVKMHARLRADPKTDYFTVYVSMDSLWQIYENKNDDLNRRYEADIAVLEKSLSDLLKKDLEFSKFMEKEGPGLRSLADDLNRAFKKYSESKKGKTDNALKVNVGTLTWNLENFPQYSACDFRKSITYLKKESRDLLNSMK